VEGRRNIDKGGRGWNIGRKEGGDIKERERGESIAVVMEEGKGEN
jgi:hypothetical protein